jgi:hypothetical protein
MGEIKMGSAICGGGHGLITTKEERDAHIKQFLEDGACIDCYCGIPFGPQKIPRCKKCQNKLYYRKTPNKMVCINNKCNNYYLTL